MGVGPDQGGLRELEIGSQADDALYVIAVSPSDKVKGSRKSEDVVDESHSKDPGVPELDRFVDVSAHRKREGGDHVIVTDGAG